MFHQLFEFTARFKCVLDHSIFVLCLKDTINDFRVKSNEVSCFYSHRFHDKNWRRTRINYRFYFFCLSVLTLLAGALLIFLVTFIMVIDCVRSMFHRPLGSVTAVSPISLPVASQVQDKSWLWKWFWGASVSPQYCVVKWGWEEPQVVGSTMTFTVKVSYIG